MPGYLFARQIYNIFLQKIKTYLFFYRYRLKKQTKGDCLVSLFI